MASAAAPADHCSRDELHAALDRLVDRKPNDDPNDMPHYNPAEPPETFVEQMCIYNKGLSVTNIDRDKDIDWDKLEGELPEDWRSVIRIYRTPYLIGLVAELLNTDPKERSRLSGDLALHMQEIKKQDGGNPDAKKAALKYAKHIIDWLRVPIHVRVARTLSAWASSRRPPRAPSRRPLHAARDASWYTPASQPVCRPPSGPGSTQLAAPPPPAPGTGAQKMMPMRIPLGGTMPALAPDACNMCDIIMAACERAYTAPYTVEDQHEPRRCTRLRIMYSGVQPAQVVATLTLTSKNLRDCCDAVPYCQYVLCCVAHFIHAHWTDTSGTRWQDRRYVIRFPRVKSGPDDSRDGIGGTRSRAKLGQVMKDVTLRGFALKEQGDDIVYTARNGNAMTLIGAMKVPRARARVFQDMLAYVLTLDDGKLDQWHQEFLQTQIIDPLIARW